MYNADNEEFNSTTSITFYLTDVNDNAPYFTQSLNDTCVYENATTGQLVIHYACFLCLISLLLRLEREQRIFMLLSFLALFSLTDLLILSLLL